MLISSRTMPVPALCMPVISPLRWASFSMTMPWNSSGTSMVRSSMGSSRCPSRRAWVMTSGRDTHNSMPSRRISSMRMPRCSSPRPETFTPSGRPRSSTRRATFTRSSRSEPVLDLAEGHRLAVLAGERTIVDQEEHGDGRFLDLQRGEGRVGQSGGRQRVADHDVVGAVHPHDVAGVDLVDLLAFQAAGDPQVGGTGALAAGDRPVLLTSVQTVPLGGGADQLLPSPVDSLQDPAAADAPQVVAPGQGRDLHAEGGVDLRLGGRHLRR